MKYYKVTQGGDVWLERYEPDQSISHMFEKRDGGPVERKKLDPLNPCWGCEDFLPARWTCWSAGGRCIESEEYWAGREDENGEF